MYQVVLVVFISRSPWSQSAAVNFIGSRGLMCCTYSEPEGGVQGSTGVPPTQELTAPTAMPPPVPRHPLSQHTSQSQPAPGRATWNLPDSRHATARAEYFYQELREEIARIKGIQPRLIRHYHGWRCTSWPWHPCRCSMSCTAACRRYP
jgi:hypothetical protein|eukprot:SAG25_NODE_147_length_13803_cov_29.064361_9_plen_149_part_00